MRLFYFPVPVTVAVDIAVWLVVQFAAAKFVTGLPAARINPASWLFKPRGWERGGVFYEALGVRRWKDRLPDAGPWFAGGFAKRDLSSRGPDYLRRFLLETCRGEWAHWLAMAAAPFFFLCSTPWRGTCPALSPNATIARGWRGSWEKTYFNRSVATPWPGRKTSNSLKISLASAFRPNFSSV